MSAEPTTSEDAQPDGGGVWRNPAYLRLWLGESLSQVGENLGQLAIPVLAVVTLRATAQEVGFLNAAETLAFLVIGLPVGAWVDRMRKRRVLIAADAVRAAALLSVPLLWWAGLLQVWQLFIIGAVVGGATVFFDVGYQSYVPRIVRGDQLATANSGLETSAQVARVGGPALSGGLLAILPAPIIVLATSIGYAFSLLFVSTIPDDEPKHERGPHSNLAREIGEGLRFVFANPFLRRITMNTAASNLFGGLVTTLLSLYVLRTLGLSPAVFGVVTGVGAVGGILGALAAGWAGRLVGEGRVIAVSTVISSLALFPLLFAHLWPAAAVPLLIGAEFVWAFGVLVYNISQLSFRQRICPPKLMGRMNASIRFVVWGVLPISGVIAGFLGDRLGVVPTMWLGAILSLLACGIILFSPLARMRALPDQVEDAPAGA